MGVWCTRRRSVSLLWNKLEDLSRSVSATARADKPLMFGIFRVLGVGWDRENATATKYIEVYQVQAFPFLIRRPCLLFICLGGAGVVFVKTAQSGGTRGLVKPPRACCPRGLRCRHLLLLKRSPLLLRNQAHSYRAVEHAWFFFGVGFLWEATEISGSNFFPENGSPYTSCAMCALGRVGSPAGNTRGSELGANPHPLRVCYYYNYRDCCCCCCCCTPVLSSLFAELAAGRTHAALFRDRQ